MVVRESAVGFEEGLVSRVRYFDPAEANRSLIYIRRVAEDITDVYAEVVEQRVRIETAVHPDELSAREDAYKLAMRRLSDLVEELHQAGVELRDFETGTIDFPAMGDEGEIFLCWQVGEPEVAHWHEADTCCDHRQSLESLPELIG